MAATVDLSAALGEFGADKATRAELQQLQQVIDGLRQALTTETTARQQAVAGEGQARAVADAAIDNARYTADVAEGQARQAADAAEAQARQAGDVAEGQARAEAIAKEQRDRSAAVEAMAVTLRASIDKLDATLRDLLTAEEQVRGAADAFEQQQRQSADDQERRERVDAIAAQEKSLADASRLQAEALRMAVAGIDTVTDAIAATVAAQRLDFIAPTGRPGDAPLRYTLVATAAALAGQRANLPFLPPGLIVGGDSGPVARIAGAAIMATRAACPVEIGRLYRARYVVQRRSNPSNPSGDAAICGIAYLDQSLRLLGDIVPVRLYPDLTAAAGRQECEALIARSAGLSAAFQAPADARFLVPVVALYGPDAVTDVEILGVEDVTAAVVLDPPVANFEARLSAYDAADVLGRLERLEQQAGSPSKMTFGSKGDAQYAAIPAIVQIVELLGSRFAGDGGAGLFLRIVGDAPAGADTFTSHGAVFQRIRFLPEVAAAILDAGFEPFMAGLPKDPPDQSGKRWMNNGFPSVTP